MSGNWRLLTVWHRDKETPWEIMRRISYPSIETRHHHYNDNVSIWTQDNDKKVQTSTDTNSIPQYCMLNNINTGGIHCEGFDAAVTQLPRYDPHDIIYMESVVTEMLIHPLTWYSTEHLFQSAAPPVRRQAWLAASNLISNSKQPPVTGYLSLYCLQ